jgi:hypothetical protein
MLTCVGATYGVRVRVMASEAKQSRNSELPLDCFVVTLLAMTTLNISYHTKPMETNWFRDPSLYPILMQP